MLASLVFAAALTVALARFDLHMNAAAVLTGSMRPTFSPGDAVLTRPVPVDQVRPGMVVLAVPPGETTPYAHRVISVTRHGSAVVVRTKGDANPAPDRWQDVYAGPTVPRVVGAVPKLGYLLVAVQGSKAPRGLPFLVAGLLVTLLAASLVLVTAPVRPEPLGVPA